MSVIDAARETVGCQTVNATPSPIKEAGVWVPLGGDWRRLHGDFYQSGVSLEWHDFSSPRSVEWSRSFHPDSVELCLNLTGSGVVREGKESGYFEPMTAGFYFPGRRDLRGKRMANQRHRFITVEFSRAFLASRLGACDGELNRGLEQFVQRIEPTGRIGRIQRLSAAQEQRITDFLNPPALQGARALWFEAKILELMAEFFFEKRGEEERFCDRQKRLARERVDKVVALLTENLAEPLSLEEIGRRAGCSPFHLSRTFSKEAGMTIPQYLRRLRMERAAQLLQTGKYNVTEAAMEVGYSSLSHFSQAFCQTMGRCPGLYPLKSAAP